MDRKVVCVTGGSGYIASWLVKFLLQSGYTVNATVRNTNDPHKTAHLLALEGAKERLHLLEANLLEEGSFDAAVDGCEGVFHTASPVSFTATDPQTELIDPAVKGTLNVLRSCAKVSSIKKVIITSSVASVLFSGRPLNPDVIVDETWFSDPTICKQQKHWYNLAKTLAEEAAWKFAKEHNIELVTLHPVYTIGPLLQPTLNFSVEIIPNLLNGAQEYPNGYYPTVDVRDVAYAHIRALEMSSATGRYCLIERFPHFSEILNIVHQLYPSLRLPQKCGSETATAIFFQISNEKAKTLGINFIPLEKSLKDTIESLKEKNFLSTWASFNMKMR